VDWGFCFVYRDQAAVWHIKTILCLKSARLGRCYYAIKLDARQGIRRKLISAIAHLNFTTLLASVGVFVATLVGTAAAQAGEDDWIVLRPPGEHFSIYMPRGWQQDTPTGPHTVLSFISPDPAPPGWPGIAKCAVNDLPWPETAKNTQASLDAIIAKGISAEIASKVASVLLNPVVRENRVVRISNRVAWFLSYSGRYESLGSSGFYTIADAVTLTLPGKYYTVTCTASDTTEKLAEAAWVAWQPVLLSILGTFMLEDWGSLNR
jgi:hypothetical protein